MMSLPPIRPQFSGIYRYTWPQFYQMAEKVEKLKAEGIPVAAATSDTLGFRVFTDEGDAQDYTLYQRFVDVTDFNGPGRDEALLSDIVSLKPEEKVRSLLNGLIAERESEQ